MFHTKTGLLVLVAALGAHQAFADDYIFAVPGQGVTEANLVLGGAGEVFGELNPGDNFALLNAANGSIVEHLSIPDRGRYKLPKYLQKDFAGQINRIRSHLVNLAKSDPVAPEALVTDIPALAKAIGDLRTDTSNPAHLLIIGTPVRVDTENPNFSMIDGGGQLFVPSDGLLTGPLSLSPFGLASKKQTLAGVHIHFCTLMPDGTTPYKESMLERTWAHYIALRGGQLVTFSADFRLCLKRYLEGQTAALDVTPLDASADTAMLKVSMGTAVSLAEEELAASTKRNQELERALTGEKGRAKRLADELVKSETRRRAAEQSPKFAALERKLAGTEKRADELAAELADSELRREKAEQSVKEFQSAIDESKTLDGVTTFSRFQEVRHTRHGKLAVTTGVRYRMADFPAYASSWCYINARNDSGSRINVSLGNKYRGRSTVWANPQSSVLKDVGLTKSEFTDYRQSCRFPED